MPDNYNGTAPSWYQRIPVRWWVAIGVIALIVCILYPAVPGFLGSLALVGGIAWGTVQLVRRQRASEPEPTEPQPAPEPVWTVPQDLLPVGRTLHDLESATLWISDRHTDDIPAGTCRDFSVDCGLELAGDFPSYTVVDEHEDADTRIVWTTYVLHRATDPDLEVCAAIDYPTANCCSARYV
jgi:hypothetical protein